ncbi:NAD(P)/FAD-dependent oxidoreductase [Pseudonocardia sp. T1-2H]|uniref:flavin-containing monooxygenase n=1 Tax=Pseudonocardia sp. T1-2H TaxID=3128899 RepID=UPI0031012474
MDTDRSVDAGHVDVLIVGAGLSGVGAAYRLQTEHPTRSYAILEARDAIGGTWDLFRYPGIRSDSDMFTLGYPFRPWTAAKSIADGGSILQYVRDTAAEFGIDRRIRFGRRVTRASWSSQDARWSVEVAAGATTEHRTCDFLYLCSGYYSYEGGHTPDIPGLEDFGGDLVHPQKWPADLDVTGRRVVVIGSGATAVTLVPSLAETAEHVTMLQRSPTWMTVLPGTDAASDAIRRRLPEGVGNTVVRWKNILLTQAFYQLCKHAPGKAKALLRAGVARFQPDPEVLDRDYTPRYDPWDQRLCVVPDADLFKAIKKDKAAVVTDRIARVTETGVALESGRTLDADVLVTATGLEVVACGGIDLRVDGEPVVPGRRSPTVAACSATSRTSRSASATSTRPGRCARTSRPATSAGCWPGWTRAARPSRCPGCPTARWSCAPCWISARATSDGRSTSCPSRARGRRGCCGRTTSRTG